MADNPCLTSTAATVVGPAGPTSTQTAAPAGDPPIDCFYVYPTVSGQTSINADDTIDPEEAAIASLQASRFAPRCRIFAPMYRQWTITGMAGSGDLQHPHGSGLETAAIAYGDVKAAWENYLANDNHGRGFVLIGHSQGSIWLTRLIQEEIDNNPAVRSRLVSAILLGGPVYVPTGKAVGGVFENIPACRRPDQTGCVIAYASFLNTPPADSELGRTNGGPQTLLNWFGIKLLAATPMQALCTNPADLAGGSGALMPYFSTTPFPGPIGVALGDGSPQAPTPWITTPGLYQAQCQSVGGASYLHVRPIITPGDTRALITQAAGPDYGLHFLDVNLAYGNLVDLVGSQTTAYRHRA
jgi:hypothetical protein